MKSKVSHRLNAVLALLLLVSSAPVWGGDTMTAKVRSVTDGDTVVIGRNGSVRVVDLVGIDAPELSQDFGIEARDTIRAWTKGKKVTVELLGKEGSATGARIMVDGEDLAAKLVAAGLAWASKDASGEALKAAQEKARAASEGLWAKANPTAPWDYRARA